jgi:hypothetical protein
MTLPAKRVLYALAFLAFAALSPLVVLYAWGYRYDFAKQQVEVTGILYLKSFPSRFCNFRVRASEAVCRRGRIAREIYPRNAGRIRGPENRADILGRTNVA